MAKLVIAAFFGCRMGSGHHMYFSDGSSTDDVTLERMGYPAPHQLDGSRLFLPYPEEVNHGRRTYLSALNLTVLSWWNRVWDTRPAVNSHFIYPGDQSVATMWHVFEHTFPTFGRSIRNLSLL